ncbi:hypothetical protein [Ferrimonas pelagia]|uniref:Uncharacterized protein n=1 Tax=Ferrimonas pelagia TaxID=1177826 RepID=A0ABP9EW63_9GAMM
MPRGLPLEIDTIADYFFDAGYATGLIGNHTLSARFHQQGRERFVELGATGDILGKGGFQVKGDLLC